MRFWESKLTLGLDYRPDLSLRGNKDIFPDTSILSWRGIPRWKIHTKPENALRNPEEKTSKEMPVKGLAWGIGQVQSEQGVQNWTDESEYN